MSFQIKDVVSCVASMVNLMRATQDQITDYNVGSVARTLIEAPAIEIDELYQMMFRGLLEAIPVSVYNSFSFDPLPAIGASGMVRFTVSPVSGTDIAIPAGTVVTAPGGAYRYLTGLDTHIAAGNSTVDVIAYCASTGAATNTAATTLTTMAAPIANVTATNPNAFSNGSDLETEEERKTRFRDYISTLSRGTVAALLYGASTAYLANADGLVVERVNAVDLVEPYLIDPVTYPTALVWLYIHNGSGSTSSDLVDRTQVVIDGYTDVDGKPIPGWKAAGVKVEVSAATEVPVDVTATATILSAYDPVITKAAAAAAVSAYLGDLGIGKTAVLAEIISLIMDIPGVYNCVVTDPVADVTAASGHKVMAGTVAVT